MSDDDAGMSAAEFATHFDTLQFGRDAASIEGLETIVPTSLKNFAEPIDALRTLPRMAVSFPGRTTTNPDLELSETLGEGGMGLVRLARQVPLLRDVAVKTVRDERRKDAAEALLREAYVTGQLEHPNVVPIYTLGQDDKGAPLIVMKRIAGEEWSSVLERAHREETFEIGPQIDILLQVCSAVRFAHSRGIIHRDIKPENVMIGTYDEVYLLDWGISISTDEDHPFLPSRSAATGVAGTAAYMAPEMTRNDAEMVDERTDVYLLGATLHHVLTNVPPHRGSSIFELMLSASKSHPLTFDDDVPKELAAIVNTACAPKKEDRYEDVAVFREALEAWVEHRASIEVSREAEESRRALEALIASEVDDATAHLRIHDRIGECRFGYRQALRLWPENEAARRGETLLLQTLFDYYLSVEQVGPAHAVLEELGEKPALRERLDEVRRRLEAERKKVDRLEEMEASLDLRTAATSRSRLAILLGVLWGVSTLLAIATIDRDASVEEQLWTHMISSVRSLAVVGIGVVIFRKRIFTNKANRRLMYVLFATLLTMVMMRVVFYTGNETYFMAMGAEVCVYALAFIIAGIMSDPRIAALSIIYFAAAIAGVIYPSIQLWLLVPAHLFAFAGLSWIWSPKQMDRRSALAEGER